MAIEKRSSKGAGTGKKVALTAVLLVLLAAAGLLGYLYYDKQQEVKRLNNDLAAARQEIEAYKTNPEEATRSEVRRIVAEVSQIYASLPEDEEPSIATVSDVSKLEGQPFFDKAENGDVTLIYPESRLAILYRPSNKQIVNVSSVTIQEDQEDALQQ